MPFFGEFSFFVCFYFFSIVHIFKILFYFIFFHVLSNYKQTSFPYSAFLDVYAYSAATGQYFAICTPSFDGPARTHLLFLTRVHVRLCECTWGWCLCECVCMYVYVCGACVVSRACACMCMLGATGQYFAICTLNFDGPARILSSYLQ